VFDWLLDPYSSGFMVRALGAAVIVGVFAPAVGVWIVLRRLSYLGDAMSHSALGSVGIALLIGALSAHPRLREDSVIGVVETALFGIGVLVISRNSSSLGVSLDSFLLGQILTVDETDIVGNLALMIVGLTALGLLFSDLRAATFDPVHAALVGVRVGPLRVALLMLLAIATVAAPILTFMATIPRRTRHRHAAPDPDGGFLGASATA